MNSSPFVPTTVVMNTTRLMPQPLTTDEIHASDLLLDELLTELDGPLAFRKALMNVLKPDAPAVAVATDAGEAVEVG